MADYPTANVQKHRIGPIGPFYLTIFKVLGDGTGVTLPTLIPSADVIGMWVGDITNTTSTAKTVTIGTTGIVTWSTTIESAKYSTLFILHKP
jgi:hypothetical protein